MKKQIKTAFIGCGKRARQHIDAVNNDGRLDVVALADMSHEAAESFNADSGFGAKIYTDYQEMLKVEKPDFIITCLWTPLHLPVFRDCALSGVKAVHSEKPMAPTWGECLEIKQVAEQTQCQLTFCHQRRFAPNNLKLRELLQEGMLGDIERIEMYSPKNLLDCGTHSIDQAMSFNNESPAKWVLGAVDAAEPIEWFNVKAEAFAVGTIVFENGVEGTLRVGNPDQKMGTGVRVNCANGFVEIYWDGQIGRAVKYDDPEWKFPESDENPQDAAMIGTVGNAVDCMLSGKEPELSYHKALRCTEVIFALYESVRRHACVELPVDIVDNPLLTMLEGGQLGPDLKI